MVETDWREILHYSQKELKQADKEKLCDNLSWMEADDIELYFSDLKTLFRLSQDILKFKSEQVNNLLGQLDTLKRKYDKAKGKAVVIDSPAKDSDILETISHQEELIKANKEILQQLYSDIDNLENRKEDLEKKLLKTDADSESSRDALSEIGAIAELEDEVLKKNRHIRKLLNDVKSLEEENTNLKQKLLVFKDKLKESTQIIENLTEQLFSINNECMQLKDALGKCEEVKSQYNLDIEILNKKLHDKNSKQEIVQEDVKLKLQHLKEIIKLNKNEISRLSAENVNQQEEIARLLSSSSFYTQYKDQEIKIKELQEKLLEASSQMLETAELVNVLKAENNKLKKNISSKRDISNFKPKIETLQGCEKDRVRVLEKKVINLKNALHGADEMIELREKELTDIAAKLQLLQEDEGIKSLITGIKNKKRELKIKDEGIKSLVQQINGLHQFVTELQIDNEFMRQQLNIPTNEKLATVGFLKDYRIITQQNLDLAKEMRKTENKITALEMDNYIKSKKICKFIEVLTNSGYTEEKIRDILCDASEAIEDKNIEAAVKESDENKPDLQKEKVGSNPGSIDVKAILEENEGLRSSLTEILNFLKDNSTTTSGVLTLECPSLDTVLQSMEARRAAGWFAPHMKTILELRAALGGRDALLTALHISRKETFEVMNQLKRESEKCLELENELSKIKTNLKNEKESSGNENLHDYSDGEFGTWISDVVYTNIDVLDRNQLQDVISKGDILYEKHIKHCLLYFKTKFKMLYERLTLLSINVADDKNRWSIEEEKYNAQILNLKSQLCESFDEDLSEQSPGIVNASNDSVTQCKYNYLEESYKNIRTLYENMKSEVLENKKEILFLASDYEEKLQKLMIAILDLTDKVRNSVPIELFWQQNATLSDFVLKYRNLLAREVSAHLKTTNILTELDTHKAEIINYFRCYFTREDNSGKDPVHEMLDNSIIQHQIVLLTGQLEDKTKEIEYLHKRISELEKSQNEFINKLTSSLTKEEIDFMKDSLQNVNNENRALKEQCRELKIELDNVLIKLQANSLKELCIDKEVNLLRHQILDLQTPGQSTAAISRLCNELLLAHLQGAESLQKVETLKLSLNKERQLRIDAEDMLEKQQKVFHVYVTKKSIKFRNIFDIIEILRQQYQGVLPLLSIENYIRNVNDFYHNTTNLNQKLGEIEDLRANLMIKHSVYDQINDLSKCLADQDSCSHKIKCSMLEKMKLMESDHCNKKLEVVEQSRNTLLDRCNYLEKTMLLINQSFNTVKNIENSLPLRKKDDDSLELEEIHSDSESSKKGDETYTLSTSPPINNKNTIQPTQQSQSMEMKNVYTQTDLESTKKSHKEVQSDEDQCTKELKNKLDNLIRDKLQRDKEINDVILTNKEQEREIRKLNRFKFELNQSKTELETKVQYLTDSNTHKDKLYETLQAKTESLKRQLNEIKNNNISEARWQSEANEENKSLILKIKKIENDKNLIIEDYKILINNEREEYGRLISNLRLKLRAVHEQLDQKGSDVDTFSAVNIKGTTEKLASNISELEDKCFKLNNNLETCESELKTCHSELERWKNLASERLTKMEQLSSQLKERYNQEVESYKAENQHWLVQLNETQREHMELRARLTEQKALHMKQLADKDAHIEHLRSVINSLKTQIMNMQAMISINDPSFDLSAIVEVEEVSDAISHQDSEPLELKFESTGNLIDLQDDLKKLPSSSTAVWQEPLIERLRTEKQLMSKQNAMLRKQIKALAGRERRARLDAQNLKNQVFRISTSGQKVPSAESAALQNKIASLQAQLTSARRDAHSTVALWDKWKRAQQASDRWQARYEEKCQEILKIESSFNLAKSAISRLEKEKRILLSRLSDSKNDKQLAIEKHNEESSEKSSLVRHEYRDSPMPIPIKSLLERVEAQQRRIVALEISEKGNEPLVSEYEKSLAEITSLKGQVLKLESALLEAQIKSPLRSNEDSRPDLEYWKSYCGMLKEENMQLTLRLNSLESAPAHSHHQRVNDLEQTVLTLRGLVSKLQAEQKSTLAHKRSDSRPTSGHSGIDKNRNQIESCQTEIVNLKRSIHEKDLLLEKSKEMLKIAAEREEDLLRENTILRQRLEELSENRGFLSV